MKYFATNALCLLCILISSAAKSQVSASIKPSLFSSFPDKVNCSEAELSKAFSIAADQNISLSFSNNFLFSGAVTSNILKYTNLQTVIIKSPAFGDAIFALSKITQADRSISYVGRIINKKYFDGYELKKDAFNNYQLIKIETDKVIQDCSQN